MKWLKKILGKKAPKPLKGPSSTCDGHLVSGCESMGQPFGMLNVPLSTVSSTEKAVQEGGPAPGGPAWGHHHPPLPATEWLLQLASSSDSPMAAVPFSSLQARFAHRSVPVAILRVPDQRTGLPAVFAANVAMVSSGLRAMLNLTSNEDYKMFISSLGQADGTFARALQEAAALAQAACGSDGFGGARCITPSKLSISLPSGTLRLAITPFIIKAAPKKEAALLVEHSLYQQECSLHQLLQQRDLLLGQTNTMMTLCDMQGKVLYQNAAAIQFAGNRVSLPFQTCGSAGTTGSTGSNYLKDLLQLEPELLDDMLEDIATAGDQWSAVVRMPSTLRMASTVISQRLLHSSPSQDNTLLDSSMFSMLSSTLRESDVSSMSLMSAGKMPPPAQRVSAAMDLGLSSSLLSTAPFFQAAWPSGSAASVARALSTPSTLASKSACLATGPGGINLTMDGCGSDLDRHLKPGVAQRGRAVLRQASRLHTLMEPTLSTGPASCGNLRAGEHDGYMRQSLGSPSNASVLSKADAQCKQPGCPPGDLDGEDEQDHDCWHEITVSPVADPETGATLLVVAQTDVSSRIEHEDEMAQVSDACVQLLELIFPRHVLEHLTVKQGAKALVGRQLDGPAESQATDLLSQMATKHECVTLFFCDIVGFTTMSKEVDPVVVMSFLNQLYTRYDELADAYGVYKVETVGDCYIVAGGLMEQDSDGFAVVNTNGDHGPENAFAVYQFAQAVLIVARNTLMPHNNLPMQVRVGLHSGSITAGVVGYRMPKFCLFGDTINTASRMETTCPYGCIHMSDATYALLDEMDATQYLVCTGGVEVKGKGRMITYTYNPAESPAFSTKLPSASVVPNQPPSLASAIMALYRSATLSTGRPTWSSIESANSSGDLSSIMLRIVNTRNPVPPSPADAIVVTDSDAPGVQGHVTGSGQQTTTFRASQTGTITNVLFKATPAPLPVSSIPLTNRSYTAADDLGTNRHASSDLPHLASSATSHAANGSQVGKPGSRLRSSQVAPMHSEAASALSEMGSASRVPSAAVMQSMAAEGEPGSSDELSSHVVQAQHTHEVSSGDNAIPGKVRFTDAHNHTTLTLSGSNILGLARSTVSRQASGDGFAPQWASLGGMTNPRTSGSFTLNSEAARSLAPSQSGAPPPLLSLVSALQRAGTIRRLVMGVPGAHCAWPPQSRLPAFPFFLSFGDWHH